MAGKLDQLSVAIGELRAISEDHGKKLDTIAAKMEKNNEIQAENVASLREHMMQSRLIREEHSDFKKNILERLKPIEDHVTNVQTLTRIGKWLIPLIGLPEAIYCTIQVIDWMRHLSGH